MEYDRAAVWKIVENPYDTSILQLHNDLLSNYCNYSSTNVYYASTR